MPKRPLTTLLATILVIVALGLLLWPLWNTGPWYRSIPSTRDPRLIGTWTDGKSSLTFSGDGKARRARGETSRPFQWGTDGVRLRAKYMAVDYWAFPLIPYRISGDGDELAFRPDRPHFMFPPRLHRTRP